MFDLIDTAAEFAPEDSDDFPAFGIAADEARAALIDQADEAAERAAEDARARNDDGVDLAEHRAVEREQADEREAELAHERLRAATITALHELSEGSAQRASRALDRIRARIAYRGTPDAFTDLILHRSELVAHLAARAAVTLEHAGSYDLAGQVDNLSRSFLYASTGHESWTVRAFAVERVRLAVAQAEAPSATVADLAPLS
jgi:hypothetical protein